MVPRSHLPAHIVLMNTTRELITSPTIVVVPWVDPVVDEAGASVFSRYVENVLATGAWAERTMDDAAHGDGF